MDIVQDLVKILARALFDPTHVMLVEIIVHNPASTTEQLAQALQMTTKQVQKICGALKVAGLVHTETRWEDFVPEHDVVREKRRVARSFFYVDYRQVVNMAKFKLYRLGRKIQQQTEALVQLPYRCPRCDRAYSALESLTLVSNN